MKPDLDVCNYAVLRFLPDPESGEFVNVGVVVMGVQPPFLEFVMDDPGKSQRVRNFFPEEYGAGFEAAKTALRREFERVQALIARARDPKAGLLAFQELVRPRESIFRFSEPRTIMVEDSRQVADKLFDRFVRRASVKPTEVHEAQTHPT